MWVGARGQSTCRVSVVKVHVGCGEYLCVYCNCLNSIIFTSRLRPNNNKLFFFQLSQVQFGRSDDHTPSTSHAHLTGDKVSLPELQHTLLEKFGTSVCMRIQAQCLVQ